MTESTNKPNTGFWVISIIALIWNLMGVMAYIGQAYMTEDALAALSEAEQAFYSDIPSWVTAAFAIAVFGGALGSLLLLLKKRLSKTIFVLSFIGIIVQMSYNFFMSKAIEVYGPGGMIMPFMVIIIGIFLVWYSKSSIEKGWLS